ncbi:MAG TPA: hypothetical protein ENJ64_04755, partial [Thiotrichales bacterium]|nr:hypothetical protein [Thiotrichales bacterium]
MYTRITPGGDIIEYDYDGDAADRGLDCYAVETGIVRHLDGNVFLVSAEMHDAMAFKVQLTLLDEG